MKILAVQNIECETLGTLERLFLADGFEIDMINAQTDRTPDVADGYSGIVILGGPMAVYDNLAYLVREQDLIKNTVRTGVPTIGICLGSQLIVQALGGRVYKASKKEIGWYQVSLSEAGKSDIFRGVDGSDKLKVFQWHGDTYDLPEGSMILASSDLYPQAFRTGSAIGIQFHLEVDEKMIRRWTREYSAEVQAERITEQDILPLSSDFQTLADNCGLVYKNFATDIRSRHL